MGSVLSKAAVLMTKPAGAPYMYSSVGQLQAILRHAVNTAGIDTLLQENLGALDWKLSEEDYTTLSNLPQERIFTGDGIAIDEKGPWHNYEELWDEPKVAPAS